MRKNNILFTQMIRYMYSGSTFSIKAITYSETTGKGGDVVEYKNARLSIEKNYEQKKAFTTGKKAVYEITTDNARNPNHKDNGTLNIILENGEVRKIRRVLITHFNNQEVEI